MAAEGHDKVEIDQWAGESAGWFPIALGSAVVGLRGAFPRSLRGIRPEGRPARLGTRRGWVRSVLARVAVVMEVAGLESGWYGSAPLRLRDWQGLSRWQARSVVAVGLLAIEMNRAELGRSSAGLVIGYACPAE